MHVEGRASVDVRAADKLPLRVEVETVISILILVLNYT